MPYQKVIKDMIKQTSKKFVIRYLIKCAEKIYKRPVNLGELYWDIIQKAIDYYVTTKRTNPTVNDLEKMPRPSKVYMDRYGEEYLREIEKKCYATKWNDSCEKVLEFLMRHGVTLKDVSIKKRQGKWSWKGISITNTEIEFIYKKGSNDDRLLIVVLNRKK